jgi:ABC-type amino acid transport substrate-binding protein
MKGGVLGTVALFVLHCEAQSAPILRVGSSDFPPYTMEKGFTVTVERKVGGCVVAPGTYFGIDVDFVSEALKRAQVPFLVEYHTWSRAKELLQNREIALLPGVLYDESQSRNLKYVQYDSGGSTVVLYKKGANFRMGSPSDLRTVRIGTVRDDSYGSGFEDAKRRGDAVVEPRYAALSDEENIRNLDAGRVDVAVVNAVVGKYLLHARGLGSRIKIARFRFPYGNGDKNSGIYMAFHAGVDAGLVEKVRGVVELMRREKRLECIRERYGVTSND